MHWSSVYASISASRQGRVLSKGQPSVASHCRPDNLTVARPLFANCSRKTGGFFIWISWWQRCTRRCPVRPVLTLGSSSRTSGPQSLGSLGQDKVLRLTAGESDRRVVPTLAIGLDPQGCAPSVMGPGSRRRGLWLAA